MRVIELDPKIWERGTSMGCLLREELPRSQCCLGIAANFFRVSDRRIRGVLDLVDVARLPNSLQLGRDVLARLQTINDTQDIVSDDVRIDRLNALLRSNKARFVFVLKAQAA